MGYATKLGSISAADQQIISLINHLTHWMINTLNDMLSGQLN